MFNYNFFNKIKNFLKNNIKKTVIQNKVNMDNLVKILKFIFKVLKIIKKILIKIFKRIFFKKKKLINPLKPRPREYVRIWSEDRLMLKNSVPENMKNLSFENKLRMWTLNYFKFLNLKGFIFYMICWFFLDIILFIFIEGWLLVIYYFVFKYIFTVIFIKYFWKKTRYFNMLKAECVRKKKIKKKKVFFILFLLFIFTLYFLNPLLFLTLFS